MTVPDLRAIAAQLASGQSLEAAVRAVAPTGRTELLKRCAAVHHFDAALLDVLRAVPPRIEGVHLPDLIALGAVEPVPGRPDRFRVPDLERRELYAGWWEGADAGEVIPEPLRELSARVLAHLADGSVVEALYHELVVAPEAALERFAAEFRAADAAFDLARCQDLLDVVIERLALLGPEGAAVCNAHQRRLRSRAMWMRDWRRSSRFQLPAPSARATEALLAGEVRALELWADGGMGKSTYLRWLIARRCVPEGIACARVDLEAVDPLRACREPWLLLLELAEQLDRQLPDAPFYELLSQHPGQRERLLRRPTTAPSLGAAAADIQARFAATLREVNDGRPIVIALDTLEAALPIAGTGTELGPLFTLLESLLETVPALRLVLTSRARPGFPGASAVRLEAFTDAEARTYLATKRGLERPALVDRIVASAGGVPFKLELLADVAEERPGIDPGELVTSAGADMVYLMERILRPLDPDLGALLLYGVAPRTLEHEFAVSVLGPLLPGRDIDALWRALRRYASRASWVQLDPVDVHTVRFHPSILVPMRKLLAAADAHAPLHERAAAWFDARAGRDPENATRWLCEAVFHRFQLDPDQARGDWQACVDAACADRRPDRRRALAAEVLGEDYALQRSVRTDLRARWELAVAAVQLACREAPERRAGHGFEAERALRDLRHLQARPGTPTLRKSELALVEAGVALVRGDADAARPHVETALRGRLAREDQLWLRLAYAGALSLHDSRHAAAHFRSSLSFARRGAPCDVAAVHQQLAVFHDARDQLDRALAACADGARLASGRQAVELALTRARLELRRGAPTLALSVLAEVEGDEPDVAARCAILRVQALLAAGHPLQARALADDAAERFSGTLRGAGDRSWTIAAEGRELRGKVHAELLDAQHALADFEEAADRWSRIGATAAVCRCRVRGAALQLRGLGDLAEAAARLESARRTRLERGSDVWTRRLLLGAELVARRGDRERAARLVMEALHGLRAAGRPPRSFVAATLAGLSVSEGKAQDALLDCLCAQLSHVTPATARLALLDGLERVPELSGRPELRTRLRRLVPSPVRASARYADIPERDRVLLAVRDAELDRLVGHPERSVATLEHAWSALGEDPSRATLHALVATAARVDARGLLNELVQQELAKVASTKQATPVRDGAALVQAAEALPDAALRDRVLEVARAALEDRCEQAGAWPARLLELRADSATDGDDASGLLRRADGLNESLGRKRTASVSEHELRVTIEPAEDGDGLVATALTHDGDEHELRAPRVPPLSHAASDPSGLAEEIAAFLRPLAPARGDDAPDRDRRAVGAEPGGDDAPDRERRAVDAAPAI
ncbi:hypothetical protein OJ997_17950, partial [Solirubrobacter phytolaccae]